MRLAPDARTDPKVALRAASMAKRQAISDALRRDAAAKAMDIFLDTVDLPAGGAVSGYWPIRGELDPRPLMSCLSERGHPVLLPAVNGKGQPLRFHEWCEGDPLFAGPFGTQEPSKDAGQMTPAVVVAPLLAFDGAGNRLGYGKGFYDMTLASLRRTHLGVIAIGFAFETQRTEVLPHNDWDQPLDWIVTECKGRKIV